MKIFKFEKLNKKKGFTLVETLVALFIFTSSLLAIVALSADNIVNISYAKNKLTATYLAVEGLEYIRNARDNFILFGNTGSWDTFLDSDISLCVGYYSNGVQKKCYFDVQDGVFENNNNTNKIRPCDNNTCPYFSIEDGVYYYESEPYSNYNTIFKRTVKGEEATVGGIKELEVTSEVTWEKNGKTNTVSFVDYLRNWAEPSAP